MRARRGAFGIIAAAAVAMAACSAGPSSPATNSDDGEFGPPPNVLPQILTSARSTEISPEQAAVLDRAERSGQISFDELNSLLPGMVACVEAVGLSVLIREPLDFFPGVPVPTFLVEEPPDASEEESQWAADIATACQDRHLAFATQFYTHQPGSIEKYKRSLLDNADEIRACLAKYGIALPPNPTAKKIISALAQASASAEPGGSADRERCYHGTTLVQW